MYSCAGFTLVYCSVCFAVMLISALVLLQEMQRRLDLLTRESCEFLGDSETLKIFATQLWHMLDLLTHRMKCPLVYADAETVSRVLTYLPFMPMQKW